MHRTTSRFWKCFERLPLPVQSLAESNFGLLQNNPKHPSLHFKKVGKFSGQQESAWRIVRWHMKTVRILSGYGSEAMMTI